MLQNLLGYKGPLIENMPPVMEMLTKYNLEIIMLNRIGKIVQLIAAMIVLIELIDEKNINELINSMIKPFRKPLHCLEKWIERSKKRRLGRMENITKELLSHIKKSGYQISINAKYYTRKENRIWKIYDESKEYNVEIKGEEVLVGRVLTTPFYQSQWFFPAVSTFPLLIVWLLSDHSLIYWMLYPFKQFIEIFTLWGKISPLKTVLFFFIGVITVQIYIVYPMLGALVFIGKLAKRLTEATISINKFRAIFFSIFIIGFFLEFITSK